MGRVLSMLVFAALLLPFCMIQAVRRGRPDIIIYSSPHPFGVLSCWLAARLLRAKFVFEVRDLWPLSLIELAGLSETNLLVRATGLIERFAYARADKVISLLPYAEPHMRGKGLSAGKFLWVPNGVVASDAGTRADTHDSPFIRHVRDLRQQGVFVVIYAGAHGKPNSLDGLVRSATILKQRNANVRIILVGKGESKAHLSSLAAREASGIVEFFAQQPKEDVMAALAFASAGYISLKSEPLFRFGVSPNKLWDYMRGGMPIIFACTVNNNPVDEYDCGLSVDPDSPDEIASAIIQLMRLTEQQRKAMGLKGREAVLEHYTYETLAPKLLQGLGSGRPA
ncbi:putative glycosyl transferase WbpJ [Pseudomonas reidholzensis]|uniref:Putative glycosyl transferase WbpJ n=2 Tax=Pseudomonas reidholzensis TaxID=1785162 RepID=A0A383RSV6_9PSED|nr:putative glycosyl transferase WbpJ [Pseudomonas reidholzensis]